MKIFCEKPYCLVILQKLKKRHFFVVTSHHPFAHFFTKVSCCVFRLELRCCVHRKDGQTDFYFVFKQFSFFKLFLSIFAIEEKRKKKTLLKNFNSMILSRCYYKSSLKWPKKYFNQLLCAYSTWKLVKIHNNFTLLQLSCDWNESESKKFKKGEKLVSFL